MIPPFNASLVLPPFVGDYPATRAAASPYLVDILSVVKRFATSRQRARLLGGFLAYRAALHAAGVVDGFQWIDGSFVEDIEVVRGRPPADIDLVTFASRPAGSGGPDMLRWVVANGHLFDPEVTKQQFYCDAYFMDLCKPASSLVDDTRYWFGLFSHQRGTSLWKGMLQVPMMSNDGDAADFLAALQFDDAEDLNA